MTANGPYRSNRHWVDLERVQRCDLDIDDEAMAFDEETIADMLQRLADQHAYEHVAFVLRGLVNALRGDDPNHRLLLRMKRRGAWKSPYADRMRHRRHLAWIIRLNRLQREGWQTDAAVHRISETTGCSVSRIYAGIAEERQYQKWLSETSALIKGQVTIP